MSFDATIAAPRESKRTPFYLNDDFDSPIGEERPFYGDSFFTPETDSWVKTVLGIAAPIASMMALGSISDVSGKVLARSSGALDRVGLVLGGVWNRYSWIARLVGAGFAVYDLMHDKKGDYVGWDGQFNSLAGVVGAELVWNKVFSRLIGMRAGALDVTIPFTFLTKHVMAVLAGAYGVNVENYNSYFWFHTLSTGSTFWINSLSYGAKSLRPDLHQALHPALFGTGSAEIPALGSVSGRIGTMVTGFYGRIGRLTGPGLNWVWQGMPRWGRWPLGHLSVAWRSKNPIGYFVNGIGGLFRRVGLHSIASYGTERRILGLRVVSGFRGGHPLQGIWDWGGKILYTIYSALIIIPFNAGGAALVESTWKSFGLQRFFKYTLWAFMGQPVQNALNNTTRRAQVYGRALGLVAFDFPISLYSNPHLTKRLWSTRLRDYLDCVTNAKSDREENLYAQKVLYLFERQMQEWTLWTTPNLLKGDLPGEYRVAAIESFVAEIDRMTDKQMEALQRVYYNRLNAVKAGRLDLPDTRALLVLTSILEGDSRFSIHVRCEGQRIPEELCQVPSYHHPEWKQAIELVNNRGYDVNLLGMLSRFRNHYDS